VQNNSHIGPVGVCLITLKAKEESIQATFAVTVSSHYSGSGSLEAENRIGLNRLLSIIRPTPSVGLIILILN
jgi:hypothetical protein